MKMGLNMQEMWRVLTTGHHGQAIANPALAYCFHGHFYHQQSRGYKHKLHRWAEIHL